MAVNPDGASARTGHGGRLIVGDPAASSAVASTTDTHLMARLTQWSIAFAVTQAEWADSDSAGYANRRTGRRSATGTIGGMLDKNHPAYQNLILELDLTEEEDLDMLSLALWEDGNIDTPVTYWYFPRVALSDFSMSFNVDSKEPVAWTANFGSDGKFYRPGADDQPAFYFDANDDFKTLET